MPSEDQLPQTVSTDLPIQNTDSGTLPHPLDSKWHVSIDGKVYGPYTGHNLKNMVADGRLDYDGLVQRVGGPEKWIQAADDRALSRFFAPSPPSATPKHPSVSTGDGAQVVTVNNTIAAPPAFFGEKPVSKSPFVAAILSLFIVGVGQIYNGEVGKGFLMMFGCILLWAVFLGWIINIWAILDAYSVADRKQKAYEQWMEANAAAARAHATV
nr:DUF4339 domain-containing protein [Amylibacter sp.]